MKLFFALVLSLFVTCASAQQVMFPCDALGDIVPPVYCSSNEKLVSSYAGNALIVQQQRTATQAGIGFSGNSLDLVTLNSFLSGQLYGRVVQWNNQIFSATDAVAYPTLSATGNTTSGSVVVTNVSSISSISVGMNVIGPPFYNGAKVEAVDTIAHTVTVNFGFAADSTLTATPLIFTLIDAPRIGPEGTDITIGSTRALYFQGASQAGRVFGLDIPAAISALNLSLQNYTVFVVARATSSVYRNQQFTPGLGNGVMLSLEANDTATATFYQNGQDNPGSYAVTDSSTFSLEPTDTMVETTPVVVAYTSGPTGVKQYQNEIVRSTSSFSPQANPVTAGYIGRRGNSATGGQSNAGDFWTVAVLIYDRELTQPQRAIVSAALYSRFNINQRRSRSSTPSVLSGGDSISASYVTEGLDGMWPRTANLFPNVRFGMSGVPGSQVIASPGMPTYGYTEGMFATVVAPVMNFSKGQKNIYFLTGAGGNDMVYLTGTFPVTMAVPGTVLTAVGAGLSPGMRVFFAFNGDTLPTGVAFGATYWVKNLLSPDTVEISASPTGPVITFSGTQSGTHLMIAAPKTAAQIYTGILSVVTQALAAGATKVFVSTVLPRIGTVYDYILPDLNALIMDGAGGALGHPVYTGVNTYTNPCLAENPLTGTQNPGPCFFDSGHLNDLGSATMATEILYPTLAPEFP